jgi:magnesium transporter
MKKHNEQKSDAIAEIITIYRRMKRGKNNQSTYRMLFNIDEDRPSEFQSIERPSGAMLDFCKHRELKSSKYLYFSLDSGLRQWNKSLQENETLLGKEYYWINVFNPSEEDLSTLGSKFSVHDVTLMDIREKNTAEKMELFKNYTFVSLKLFSNRRVDTEDIDFNILIFKNIIITTHDKPWLGIGDIVNFLSLIVQNTKLYPSWVFYSVVIEFLQDTKYILEGIRPEGVAQKAMSKSVSWEIDETLHENFEMVYRLHGFKQFIKPKIDILRNFIRSSRDVPKRLVRLFEECYYDFRMQERLAKEHNVILERSQDLFLALVDMEQSKEANRTNMVMKRVTQATFIFLPLQAVAGLWGMNVRVPWRDSESVWCFWVLAAIGPLFNLLYWAYYTAKSRRRGMSDAGPK